MDLMKMIMEQALSGDNAAELSKKTDISQDKLGAAIQAGLPAILEGLNQNSNTKSGAVKLDKALDKHDGSILDDLAKGALGGLDLSDGAKIVGHIFGNNEKDVVKELGKEADITKGQSANLMSALAPLVMGALGKEKKEEGLDSMGVAGLTTTLISSFLGDGGGGGGNLLGMITKVLGAAVNDSDDSIIDDILGAIF